MTTRIRIFLTISSLIFVQGVQSQWNKIYEFNVEMHDLWFINKDTGFICGSTEYPVLMRTHDGGYSWEDITSNIADQAYAVNFLDESKGFIATWGYNAKVLWGTIDSGQTWQPKFSTSPYIHTITFPSSHVGYTFAGAMEYVTVVKTTDGGSSWSQVAFLTTPAPGLGVYDAQFVTETLGYMITDGGSVYKTTNGGVEWTSMYQSFIYSMSGVCFLNQDTGFVTGNTTEYGYPEGLLLKTTNGGVNWDMLYFTDPCFDIWFPYPDTGFISTYGILKTIDSGNSWDSDTCNYTTSLKKLRFPNKQIGYALSSYPGKTIIMKRNPDIGVAVYEVSDQIRFNIFPVPALDQITIRFNTKTKNRVLAQLVTSSGVKIKTLIDATFTDGLYTIQTDISALSPGIYYLRIQTRQHVELKKVVIL